MSSETDHPRQRTVAELLAAHGDGNVSGRRRRRREADEPDEEAYSAPAAEPSDLPPAPPIQARRTAPDDGVAVPPRESGGRRRAGGDPGRRDDQRATEQRVAGPWGADEQGSDDWASERWDAGQWGDQDSWDDGRRETPSWEARPAEDPWDGPGRQARYDDAEPRDPAPRRSRRAAEDRAAAPDAPAWEPREPSRSWEPREEPPRSREREAPSWEPRAAEPERNGRDPRTRERRSRAPRSWDDPEPDMAPSRAGGSPLDERAPVDPIRDRPTDQMPRIRDRPAVESATSRVKPPRRRPEPGPDEFDGPVEPATSRIKQQRRRPEPEPDEFDDDGGPSTMVGAAPAGAEAWHRARTDGRRRPPDPDDELEPDEGPATTVGAPPAGADAWHPAQGRRRGADGGPPTQASPPLFDDDEDDDEVDADYPAGLGGRDIGEEPTGIFAAREDEPEAPVKRRSAQTEADEEAGGGPAWAAVIAQWIAGAIGGAALWVGFRFLWRDLTIVALAAAVLVTVGLVVVVRALLRSTDLRTTLFAVLVGLLLTVSPAILVLLGR